MKMEVQFIKDAAGEPMFAVLAYADYLNLRAQDSEALPEGPSLLSDDHLFIQLPNGGPGARLDVLQLADLVDRRGLISLAINQRAQTLDKFPENQHATLDPLIRRAFLSKDSPYKNTMQASNEVVDALVETGLFRRIQATYDCFYRPVKALQVVPDALKEFLSKHGRPAHPISTAELS